MLAPFGLQPKGTVSARMLPLAEALVGRGHTVTLMIPPWDNPTDAGRTFVSGGGVAMVNLPVPAAYRRAATPSRHADIPTPPALVRALADVRISVNLLRRALAAQPTPQAIHIFKPKAHSGLAALGLDLARHRFVLDSDDWEGRGGYNDVAPYSSTQKRIFAWQETDLPHRAAAVTVASHTLQTQMWGFGLPRDHVFHLPNGVSPEKYAGWRSAAVAQAAADVRARYGIADKTVFVLYTRFAETSVARVWRLWQAIARAEARAHLLVVGRGFYGEESLLAQQARAAGMADRVSIAGWVELADLPAYLHAGDVALYPFDDTLINRARNSVKLLDLLMAERPVVTDAVGEATEYVINRDGGLLTAAGDDAAFVAAALELARMPEAARRMMGAAGSARLWQHFDWRFLAARAEAAYSLL